MHYVYIGKRIVGGACSAEEAQRIADAIKRRQRRRGNRDSRVTVQRITAHAA